MTSANPEPKPTTAEEASAALAYLIDAQPTKEALEALVDVLHRAWELNPTEETRGHLLQAAFALDLWND